MEGPQGRYLATREGISKKTTAKKEDAMGEKGPEAHFLDLRGLGQRWEAIDYSFPLVCLPANLLG